MKLTTDQRKALTEAYKKDKPKKVLTVKDFIKNGNSRKQNHQKPKNQYQ